MTRQGQPGLSPRALPLKKRLASAPAQVQQTWYRGVRPRSSGKWAAEIRRPGERSRRHIGNFDTAEEAALAYDRAAYRLYGAVARLNFPERSEAWDAGAGDADETAASEPAAGGAEQEPRRERETGETATE